MQWYEVNQFTNIFALKNLFSLKNYLKVFKRLQQKYFFGWIVL